MSVAYLNGAFVALEEACVSVLDRGFLFGDGVYEVIPVYAGHLFRLDRHLQRLDDSLSGIRLRNPLSYVQWQQLFAGLVSRNGPGDQSIYLQITRGVAKRDHAFPRDVMPTVFAMSSPLIPVPSRIREQGASAITLPDIRWKYCHIKAIALLPNILLRQQALDEGADEAILIRDGKVTEGAASNVCIVRDGVIITPPKGPLLLPGVTRDLVLELAQATRVPFGEATISVAELTAADEIWLTSSTKEIVPVARLDGRAVGGGTPGPVWATLDQAYQDFKATFRNREPGP